MSTFNSLMSSDEDPDIGDSSMHLFLESSQTSEVPEQGRSPSPAQIWRPHFESPVIANSPVTVSSGACGGPQDTPRSYTRQTSTPLLGRVQQENTTRISSSCIKTLEKLFDNQRTFLQEQFVKQNALVGECLSMLKTLEKRPENGKQLNKSKNEIHVPAYIKKLINRRRTLKERKIDPKEEERFMKALEIETMSSEDSDSEDDSIFVTRPLSWVSTEFKQLIQRLDRKYDRTLNAQGKRLKSKRTVGEPSDRPCPKKPKGLEWISTPDLCYHHDGVSPLVINITCPTGTIGRYVQIYKPNGVDFNITRQPLSLCEVEVYGRSILTDPNDTVIETTTGNSLSTDDSICQCPCDSSTFAWSSNYTKEELQIIMSEKLENLKRELRVQRSVLTSSLRKLNSAGDNRSSSKSIGIAAAIFLIIVVCLIVLLDLIKLENIKVKRKKSKKEIPK
ncbi:unnamed protein product [Mytilus edulis]|uniref:Uncharacterized protein n=1 Tax=Mytilus edulis TaxID=6550 RepID=A0A8S3VLQ1_MYTED|nr:unnamed protein product [Mytilus edulis]